MEPNHLKIGENKILREGDELHPDELHSCPMCDSDTEVDPFEPSWFTITCDKCEWSVEVQLKQIVTNIDTDIYGTKAMDE